MSLERIFQEDNGSAIAAKINAAMAEIERLDSQSQGGTTPSSGDGGTSFSPDRVLNILHIGNSHTEDAWSYVPFMLLEYGIRVRMMIIRAAGQGVTTFVNYYDKPLSQYVGGSGQAITPGSRYAMWYIDTSLHTSWQSVKQEDGTLVSATSNYNDYWYSQDHTIKEAVTWQNMPWDLITIQENYNTAASSWYQGGAIASLIDKINGDLSFPCLFGLQIVHTKSTDGYSDIPHMAGSLANHHNAYINNALDMFFPSGTAIANLRQVPDIGDIMDAAGIHLREGLPRYVSSLACMESLLRRFYPMYSVLGDKSRPNSGWRSGKGIPSTSSAATYTVDGTLALLAQRLALLANDHPWDIMELFSASERKRSHVLVTKSVPSNDVEFVGAFPTTGLGGASIPAGSNIAAAVRVREGSGAVLTGVTWTMDGVDHAVEIDAATGAALLLVKDIRSDLHVTVTVE